MGLPYEKQEAKPAKDRGPTKAEMVEAIAARLNGVDLEGLEKATASALATLEGALTGSE